MANLNYKTPALTFAFIILLLTPVISESKNANNKKSVVKWAIHKTSTLRINGKTNVAGFGCDINGYYAPDTILYSQADDPGRIVPLKGALNINVNNFDCHNKMLTADLRKTLKAKQFPSLVVKFVALERMPVITKEKDKVKGWVEVELAGVSRRFEICYTLEKNGSLIQMDGARCFSFSDFKLSPPQKLAGLVKVKDEFNVDFKLVLSQVI